MIAIDFQGGAHGNFLEFACNIIAGVTTSSDMPFNKLGASHSKKYLSTRLFNSNHYSYSKIEFVSKKVISVQINSDDLLPLSQISLLRAGDYNYDSNELEVNTYHKFNNINYKWVLDTIINSFFVNQVRDSYNAVKDDSWPPVESLAEFNALPDQIKNECMKLHKLELIELSESSPNCPRHILREFFQKGFENTELSGFLSRQQSLMVYPEDFDVYVFPFSVFYQQESFLLHTKKIAQWANLSYNCQDKLTILHQEFMSRQPYWNSKIKCDEISTQLMTKNISVPTVTLLEEAYLNAILKKHGYECRY